MLYFYKPKYHIDIINNQKTILEGTKYELIIFL